MDPDFMSGDRTFLEEIVEMLNGCMKQIVSHESSYKDANMDRGHISCDLEKPSNAIFFCCC